ncbi:putative membrane protein [Oopsacas minuta]|uniref:Transmembrane protein 192 n=1 Tax=Oopsacas minuta TaxID=111878 RepID=A0AAV7JV37_9METZ|nr:putative membrane protein [Oopsacas minuta]
MVSLNETRGGFFYTETAERSPKRTTNDDIPEAIIHPRARGSSGGSSLNNSTVIRMCTRNHFKYILTGYLSLFELFVLIVYSLACFIDIYFLPDITEFESVAFKNKFSFYALFHVFLWIIVFIIDRIVQHFHNKIRLRGYLRLYLRLRNIRRIPFIVYSTGLAAIVLVFSIERQLTYLIQLSTFRFDYFITIIVGIEVIVSGVGLIIYFAITLRFNYTKPKPDTIGTEDGAVVPFLSAPPGIGFSRDDDTENVEELLDKQADMIRYLKAHNANLGRKINELRDRLGSRTDM